MGAQGRPITPGSLSQGMMMAPAPGDVIKAQRSSTPSGALEDKDGNESDGMPILFFFSLFWVLVSRFSILDSRFSRLAAELPLLN